jgi:[ribosomal protein S5]-alanine N-acetyltransferase
MDLPGQPADEVVGDSQTPRWANQSTCSAMAISTSLIDLQRPLSRIRSALAASPIATPYAGLPQDQQEASRVAEIFDYSTFPTLTTERTVLREWEPDDAADMFVWRSDPEVQKYNSEPMRDVTEATALIDEIRGDYSAQRGINWAVTLRGDGRAIGLFGFVSWERGHYRANIGYDLRRDYWGRGIATEALNSMLGFGFTNMHLNRVEAQTIADNHESVRLLQRCGFRRDGLRRAYSLEHDGTYHDGAIYGLLRHEYRGAGRAGP